MLVPQYALAQGKAQKCLTGAALLLQARTRRSLSRLTLSSGLLIAGVFVHRLLIMPAAYNDIPLTFTPLGLPGVEWSLPIASGRFFAGSSTFVEHYAYAPSLIEIVILLGIVAYAIFLILLAIAKLPILAKKEVA